MRLTRVIRSVVATIGIVGVGVTSVARALVLRIESATILPLVIAVTWKWARHVININIGILLTVVIAIGAIGAVAGAVA